MTVSPPRLADDKLSDSEVISAVRAGDLDAYQVLWARHSGAARSFARQLVRHGDVDDVVSDGFAKIFSLITRGGGPDGSFRPYLFTTMRRLTIDHERGYGGRTTLTGDLTDIDPRRAPASEDSVMENAERSAAWLAWDSLPDSSRTLLWHLVIEEERASDVARIVGGTPNSISSRLVRAKERLRQAFLQQHVLAAANDECREVRAQLGAYQRKGLGARDHAAAEAHLQTCDDCSRAAREVAALNTTLRAQIAPVVLGGPASAAAYLKAGRLALWRRRDGGPQAGALATAVLTGVILTALAAIALSLTGDDEPATHGPASTSRTAQPADLANGDLSSTSSIGPSEGSTASGASPTSTAPLAGEESSTTRPRPTGEPSATASPTPSSTLGPSLTPTLTPTPTPPPTPPPTPTTSIPAPSDPVPTIPIPSSI